MPNLLQYSEWLISAPVLFAIAWVRFNSPPTNRSGTTFVLFSVGLTIYSFLIVALWLLIIVAVSQGISLGKFNLAFGKAQGELAQHAPLMAAFVLVAATHFSWVHRMDNNARAFCMGLAAIPRQADWLAVELAQTVDFQPKSELLRNKVSKIITEDISAQALRFEADGSPASRFTRAVGLYWLFVGPNSNGTKNDFISANGQSAYTRIMQLSATTAERAAARYEELMQAGRAYFATPQPSREIEEALNRSIGEVALLTCSLIARYVLYSNATESKRRHRLSTMGFDASGRITFGADQWVITILAVIALSAGMMALMPGTQPLSASHILRISITFGLSIGFAVIGAVWVAQRFLERHQGEATADPPIAQLALAALIVAGLSAALRIAIPLVPALIQGSSSALPDAITQFLERWPGVIIPSACTMSLGLLCTYLCARSWSQLRIAAAGALGNALAFMAAALVVAWLLSDDILIQVYKQLKHARVQLLINTGLIGVVIGFMVLWQFKRSERDRVVEVSRAAERAGTPTLEVLPPSDELDAAAPPRSDVAARSYGGYARANVEYLEGRYLCLRPAFTLPNVICVYLMELRWDHVASCLTFEEKNREDCGHTQRGRVYIPDGRPFMSFVTVAQGGIRLITVSRPGEQSARGLIMTLSNPSGMQFTPASAPIVLRRVTDKIPQLGFIAPDAPDYDSYRQELVAVAPAFGFFASAPRPASGAEAKHDAAAETREPRLSIVG
jgi:hypothetical protein